ncbi:unnamed protein product [Citrullus colocynthis]|uniref:Protein kinase domain-containing protein n=1 Tax=Citrullus colocynthis TaxID=252529 RepID=A0ABP0YAB7_9ROSI
MFVLWLILLSNSLSNYQLVSLRMSSYFSPPSDNGEINTGGTVFYVVLCFLIFAVIGAISYCFARKVRQGIVRELQNVVVSAAADVARSPVPNVVQTWEIDQPTMEKFIREMAEERPVRFTPQQLYCFTSNYSAPLGSGGFVRVYKGQFPNDVKIAVKVLKRNSDRQAEEQFMAEVGTIGRTYHINLVRLYCFVMTNIWVH